MMMDGLIYMTKKTRPKKYKSTREKKKVGGKKVDP